MKTDFSKYGYSYRSNVPKFGETHSYRWRKTNFNVRNSETFFTLTETHYEENEVETEIVYSVGVRRISFTISPDEYQNIPKIESRMRNAMKALRT